jgi:hypothetical protein
MNFDVGVGVGRRAVRGGAGQTSPRCFLIRMIGKNLD